MTETRPSRPGILPAKNLKDHGDTRVYYPCENREAITEMARQRKADIYLHDGAFMFWNNQEPTDWMLGRQDLALTLHTVLRSFDDDPHPVFDDEGCRPCSVTKVPNKRLR